jgi:putative transposase
MHSKGDYAMGKILPSEKVSKEISALLESDHVGTEDFLSEIIRKSVKRIFQEILEQEVQDYLGRGYYERNPESRRGYRNGYESKRLKTAEGNVVIDVPQLRNTDELYRSQFLRQQKTISPELERLAIEMYTRGLSTRDIEDALKGKDGKTLISKTGVSEITKELSEEYERFCTRDLSHYDVVYLFVDGVYESLRRETGPKEALLCAWGILSNGRKVLLHLALGNKESYASWKDFFRNMISRGLRTPLVVTSDGAPGLIVAVKECFPESTRQRCLVHKLRTIANKLPQDGIDEVMPKIKNAYYQTDQEVAKICAENIINEYSKTYPAAVKCFQEDFEACITHMSFPAGHSKHIRTTNLLERAFVEQRRRTKIIPRFLDEQSCLKLVYATLIRVSDRWHRVKMTNYDLTVLKHIRKLYGWKDDQDGFISYRKAA